MLVLLELLRPNDVNMKNGLRLDEEPLPDAELGFWSGGVVAASARAAVDAFGATLAVNFDTLDCELLIFAFPNNGTVSRVGDADFDFCVVYEANL